MMRRTAVTGALVGLVLLGASAGRAVAAGPAVALVAGETANAAVTDVQNKLIATGQFSTVDVIDATSVTPTVAQLQAYRAILVWSDDQFLDRDALGNNIDTYLRGGGGVVIAVFANTDPGNLELGGAFAAKVDSPMTVENQSQGTELTLGTIHVPGSPLLANVTSFDGGASSFYDPGMLTAGAVDIADWSNGTPLVAIKLIGNSVVVLLNFWPPSSDYRSDLWVSSTNGTQLMTNALLFAGQRSPGAAAPALSHISLAGLGVVLVAGGVWLARKRTRAAL